MNPQSAFGRDKRWEVKCFKCSQISVAGWGEKRKSDETGIWKKWPLNHVKTLGFEKLSYVESDKYSFLQLVMLQP